MSSIADLLRPYVLHPLSAEQVNQLKLYLDLLLKWNAKINLTAIRNRDDIVRRHFGESLFAGEQLEVDHATSLIDVGSGAGFPGLPIKIFAPQVKTTLVEAQGKKVAFLREAVHALGLKNVMVHPGRAEDSKLQASIVTMRAVEKFESAIRVAETLVSPGGKLALLIGAAQTDAASKTLPKLTWQGPVPIPESRERVLLVGRKSEE